MENQEKLTRKSCREKCILLAIKGHRIFRKVNKDEAKNTEHNHLVQKTKRVWGNMEMYCHCRVL